MHWGQKAFLNSSETHSRGEVSDFIRSTMDKLTAISTCYYSNSNCIYVKIKDRVFFWNTYFSDPCLFLQSWKHQSLHNAHNDKGRGEFWKILDGKHFWIWKKKTGIYCQWQKDDLDGCPSLHPMYNKDNAKRELYGYGYGEHFKLKKILDSSFRERIRKPYKE